MKTALISVSNKEGIVDFAQALVKAGYRIISTGGTAQTLQDGKIAIIQISKYTGSPEVMDGRVKTLHPKVFGGLLAKRDNPAHMKDLTDNTWEEIDLVVVNLYPFEETVGKGASFEECIEHIDIGGPSLLRAAAKNYQDVAVIVDPADYEAIAQEISKGDVSEQTKKNLALKVFEHTARYDTIINQYFLDKFGDGSFPDILNLTFRKEQDLRYGENPHQKAAFYKDPFVYESSVGTIKQLHGKELSFNNILDVDHAFELVKEFSEPASVVVKHTNPSGVSVAASLDKAYEQALAADPLSAYGSIVALNKNCDVATAKLIRPNFVEVVICPQFEKDALALLQEKKNCRLLEVGPISKTNKGFAMKKLVGGLLAQSRDFPDITKENLNVVTKRKPTKEEINDLLFANIVNKHVKSNAIIFAKDNTSIGIGTGQMSRVDSVKIAAEKSGEKAQGAVMSSDAFFPFRDGIDVAAKAGIKAIIQPGGSMRDKEVIEAADEQGIAMVFTGVRLFKH